MDIQLLSLPERINLYLNSVNRTIGDKPSSFEYASNEIQTKIILRNNRLIDKILQHQCNQRKLSIAYVMQIHFQSYHAKIP
jgi:hypothetical protein